MASMKQPSWKCSYCNVLMKGTFPRCWKCGYEWAQCADRTHVPQEHRGQQPAQPPAYAHGQQQSYAAPWTGEVWQDSTNQSPRSKSRRSSPRAKKNQNQGQAQKGKGKGAEYFAQPMPPTLPMMPSMMPSMPSMPMPYTHPGMPTIPMQAPEKGFGKGMPPPPLGPPPGHFGPTPATSMWAPSMQMMPTPVPFAPVMSPEETEEQKNEMKAQQKLSQLLGAMKKEEETLSPSLQSMAHQMQKKDERDTTKGVCDAAQKLGNMKEKLLDAEQARAKYLSQWKTFLQQSVTKWQEFASQFTASDSAHQAAIRAARSEVRKAQKKFDMSTKKAGQADGGESKIEEISDDEEEQEMEVEAFKGESAQKIQEGMQVIVSSLVELSESADQLEQRVKRPRKATEEEAKAQENAINIAEDVGSPLDQWIDVFSLPLREKKETRTVTFADNVQLCFATDDSDTHSTFHVRHDTLTDWPDKPWKLKPSRQRTDVSIGINSHSRVVDSLEEEREDGDPHILPADFPGAGRPGRAGHHHPGAEYPEWFGEMWDLLQAEGTRAEDDDGLVVFLNSFYINHHTHRFHQDARPLRFDTHYEDWEAGVRLVWEDLLDPTCAFSVVWVRPDPPFAQSSLNDATHGQPAQPEDWRRTVLFTMDGRAISIELPWHLRDTFRLYVAEALEIDAQDLLDHHVVHERPPDFIEVNLHCILPQLEARPSPFLCLVLLDTEIYEPNEVQPSAFRRSPRWAPAVATWTSVFRILGLERHCVDSPQRCRLWVNNDLIEASQVEPVRFVDGDYVRIFIGDVSCGFRDLSHLDISEDAFDQLGIPEDAFDEMSVLQRLGAPDFGPDQSQPHQLPSSVWSCDRPFLAQQVEQHRTLMETSRVPDLVIPHMDDWQLPLGMHFLTSISSFTSTEDAQTEWLTWYLHITDHPRCEAPRTLLLDVEREFWHRDIAILWRDRLQSHVATQIHLVQPDPPRADSQTHSGHLLIVQGYDMQAVPTLITTKFRSAYGHRLSQVASFLPQFVTNHDLTRLLRLERVCLSRPCFAEVDGLDLDHEGFAQLQPGDGVCFHVLPPDDATSFMQTSVHHRFISKGEPACQVPEIIRVKLDQDDLVRNSTLDGRERDAAPPQAWVRLHGTQDPPRLQEDPLWSLWNRPHLQVLDQEHQLTMQFETWYVSSIGYPRCSRSRIVSLNADVDAWLERLRQVWSDRISPHMHLELAIVHPAVPHEVHGGHLILIQAVTPEEKATLLSSYWNSRNGALQDRFAQLVPPRLSFPDLLQFNFLDTLCHHPEFACRAQVGERAFEPYMHWPVYHGLHLEVFIDHVAMQALVQAFMHPVDAVDIPQLPPQEADSFVQARPRRRRPARDDHDDEADDRQRYFEQLWSRAHLRERGLHQEPVMVFDTWFLSALNFPRCSTARTIALSSDTSEWYESLLRLWRDRRHPHFPVEIHQVLPAPPRHPGDRLGGHLLLLQHHSPDEAGVLFSNYHGQESTQPIDRFAQLVPSALTLERIFWYNDWERVCDQPAVLCQGFYGNRVIRPDTIWPAANGQHLELHWS
eukprot:s3102_g10.t1